MELTKEDSDVLRILVRKELSHLKKDEKDLRLVNSPFLNKMVGDSEDIPFLAGGKLYEEFLSKLLQKLEQ